MDKVLAIFYAYEAYEIDLYAHAAKVSGQVWELRSEVRSWLKYEHTKSAEEMIDIIYEALCSIGDDI